MDVEYISSPLFLYCKKIQKYPILFLSRELTPVHWCSHQQWYLDHLDWTESRKCLQDTPTLTRKKKNSWEIQSHWLFVLLLFKHLAYLKVLIKYLRMHRVKNTPKKYYWLLQQWFIRKVNLLFVRKLVSCWHCYNPWLRERTNFLRRDNSSFNMLLIIQSHLRLYFLNTVQKKKKKQKPTMYLYFSF